MILFETLTNFDRDNLMLKESKVIVRTCHFVYQFWLVDPRRHFETKKSWENDHRFSFV